MFIHECATSVTFWGLVRDKETLKKIEMATTAHSPRMTRAQASALPSEAEVLRAVMQELRQLREERRQDRAEFVALLRQREESQRELEQRINELSQTSNRIVNVGEFSGEEGAENSSVGQIGVKLKPDVFDGSVPLREYFTQFELISKANNWSDAIKTVILASNLRGKARSILENFPNLEGIKFSELKAKLELRFNEGYENQSYYTQFINRKQKFDEDLPALGADLERLARLAYPECPFEVRDKIACAQFVVALSNSFIKQTLQLEGIVSLKSAIKRAMIVQSIQRNSFSKRENLNFKNDKSFSNLKIKSNKDNMKPKSMRKGECWQCGSLEHFRAECPSLTKQNLN